MLQTVEAPQRPLPELRGPRVTLRLPVPDEAAAVVRYYRENRDHLAPYEPSRGDDFFTAEHWETQLAQRLAEARHDESLKLFLYQSDDPSRVIGAVNFSHFVHGYFQACSLGYNLAAGCEGRGLMTEALRLAVAYVFGPLNLHRIMANHLPDNERSARLLARLGFAREGLAKDYLLINGQWRDHTLNSLVNPDWSAAISDPR